MIGILVSIFVLYFLSYSKQLARDTEWASIRQTSNIINSSLAIVFATYAVNGELDLLNDINGENPFIYLAEYNVLPTAYRGEISIENLDEIDPGWYYNRLSRKVIYKSYHEDQIYSYSIVLDYRDIDRSGRFESSIDEYRRLIFRQVPQQ